VKYFTRGWANGEHDDEESDRIRSDYARHFASIAPRLPPALRELHVPSLHDALIEQVRWQPSQKQLTIAFLAWREGTPMRPVRLRAIYGGALLGEYRVETLRGVARDRESCVLYDEVDVADDGLFVHRILFSPRDEIGIDFATLELAVEARVDSRIELQPAFVEEFDEDEDSPASQA
jgi:hypothetical protein